MIKKKVIFTTSQIKLLAESEFKKLTKEDVEEMAGEPSDRRVEYPEPGEEMGDETKDSQTTAPPNELMDFLKILDEAESLLSKIAAKEQNEELKKRILAQYGKMQKVKLDCISEFNIVH